jgi:formamidopyrimidine-DNA glycosylase
VPELPDVTVYVECLARRIAGVELERVRLASPFLLRSVEPPISAVEGRRVRGVRRIGKRIVIELEDELFLVMHLMIAGRLRWRERSAAPASSKTGTSRTTSKPTAFGKMGKIGLAELEFASGTLLFTEAGTKKRAAMHVVRGERALSEHDPGGLEVLECNAKEFAAALASENHTLKRSLTDPTLFSGIGNAYSDEILHRAQLSPLKLTQSLTKEETARLFSATTDVLREWIERLRREVGEGFPDKVTAFRPEMAVHGRYGKPCPVCGSPVQRIVYAENECNYCARCQTGGKLLADRALSRLLKQDWPRTIEEMENRKRRA